VRFLSLTLLPTGEKFDDRLVEPANLQREDVKVFQDLLQNNNVSVPTEIPTFEPLQLQCTMSPQGVALGTFWIDGKILLSTIMLAGQTPDLERDVFTQFYESIAHTKIVAELTATSSPFPDFLIRKERPACFGVLWPILSYDDYTSFAWADIYLATAFFERIGIKHNA